jgi:hypothetical protein
MKQAAWLALLLLARVPCALADEASSRALFDQAIVAVADDQLERALDLFEASLREAERPATRYNLALANHRMGRPLEVARHALILLDGPEPEMRHAAHDRVRTLLFDARAQLSVLRLRGEALAAELRVDGREPELRHRDEVYVLPGLHRLQTRLAEGTTWERELLLAAGMAEDWPLGSPADTAAVGRPAPASREPVVPASPPAPRVKADLSTRRNSVVVASASVGTALELAAATIYIVAAIKAAQLSQRDPSSAAFIADSDAYWRLRLCVWPFAAAGGALMTGATVAMPKPAASKLRAAAGIGASGVALGAGSVLLAITPSAAIEGTDVRRPTRELGALLVSSALPLLVWGIRSAIGITKGRVSDGTALRQATRGIAW